MIAPSLVIITIIAAFISNFMELDFIASAFNGIRACVCVLILDAVIKLAKKSVIDRATTAIFIAVVAVSLFTDISPVLIVIAAGALGIILKKGEK